MAEAHETAMDYKEHRKTYEGFVRFAAVVSVWALIHLVGLAIGGIGHSWFLAGFWVVVGTIAAAIGLAVKGLDWKPAVIVLTIMLATLLMVTH